MCVYIFTHTSNHCLKKAPSMFAKSSLIWYADRNILLQIANNGMTVVNSECTRSRHRFNTLKKHKSVLPPRSPPVPLSFLSRHTPLQQVPNLFSTPAGKSEKNHPHRESWLALLLKHWWKKNCGKAEFRCLLNGLHSSDVFKLRKKARLVPTSANYWELKK